MDLAEVVEQANQFARGYGLTARVDQIHSSVRIVLLEPTGHETKNNLGMFSIPLSECTPEELSRRLQKLLKIECVC